jgi:hypothetical protein
MIGDPHTLVADHVMPKGAFLWPDKRVVVAKNERNGVTVVLVLDAESGKPVTWPWGMTQAEVHEICQQCLKSDRLTYVPPGG